MRLRQINTVVIVLAVTLATGCDAVESARSRFGKTTTDTVLATTGSGLALGLQAPSTLRPGDEGILRLSLTNQTDTVVSQVRLELLVPAWAEPMPPRVGERPVSMAALQTGQTQFSYRVDDAPLNPRQVQSVDQRIRVPLAGLSERGNALWTRTVKARLLAPDGRALAEVQTEIALDSAAVAAVSSSDVSTVSRREQLGPVKLGMTADAVKRAAPKTRDTTWSHAGSPQRGLLVPVSGQTALALLNGDEITRIEVGHSAIHTNERLGVGSRMQELRAAYGAPCVDVIAGHVVVWFAAAPGIAFSMDTPAPQNRAQLDASRISGTAKVTRWWLSRDVDVCATGG